jgi:hypothetical protein
VLHLASAIWLHLYSRSQSTAIWPWNKLMLGEERSLGIWLFYNASVEAQPLSVQALVICEHRLGSGSSLDGQSLESLQSS